MVVVLWGKSNLLEKGPHNKTHYTHLLGRTFEITLYECCFYADESSGEASGAVQALNTLRFAFCFFKMTI